MPDIKRQQSRPPDSEVYFINVYRRLDAQLWRSDGRWWTQPELSTGTNGSQQEHFHCFLRCFVFARDILADLPFLHIRRSQRCFTLMQSDDRLASKVKPTGG